MFRHSVGGKDYSQNKCSLLFNHIFEMAVTSQDKSFLSKTILLWWFALCILIWVRDWRVSTLKATDNRVGEQKKN